MTYLKIPASKHALIEDQSLRNKIGFREFYVRIAVVRLALFQVCALAWQWDLGNIDGFSPFWMPSELVQQDSDPVNRPAALEMCLDLLW